MAFWNKRIEQSPEEIGRQRLEEEEARILEQKLSKLDRFPGSLEEYIALKKEEGVLSGIETVVPMSTGRPEKWIADTLYTGPGYDSKTGMNWDGERKLLSRLIQDNCIGLIRYQRSYNSGSIRSFGIPVKIKMPKDPAYR